MQMNLFHKSKGKLCLNRFIICCFIQNQITIQLINKKNSDRLSPITKLITDVENEANEYHEEWQNMNEILTELQSVRRKLHDVMARCLEDFSHPLTLDKKSNER